VIGFIENDARSEESDRRMKLHNEEFILVLITERYYILMTKTWRARCAGL
jgi:hypothetical protein